MASSGLTSRQTRWLTTVPLTPRIDRWHQRMAQIDPSVSGQQHHSEARPLAMGTGWSRAEHHVTTPSATRCRAQPQLPYLSYPVSYRKTVITLDGNYRETVGWWTCPPDHRHPSAGEGRRRRSETALLDGPAPCDGPQLAPRVWRRDPPPALHRPVTGPRAVRQSRRRHAHVESLASG